MFGSDPGFYPVYSFFRSAFWNAERRIKTSRGCRRRVYFDQRMGGMLPPSPQTRSPKSPERSRRPLRRRSPLLCYLSEEPFPRWDGEGARDPAPAPAAIQLLLLLLLPLLPLLLLLLHQNHFSFSSHPEVNNPDSTITAYLYFLPTGWVFPRRRAHRPAAGGNATSPGQGHNSDL